MRSLILYFFLLVLEVLFNLIPDIVYKYSKFSKNLLKKSLKFFSSGEKGLITFNPGLILLPAEVNLILEEQSYKRYAFVTLGFSDFEIVFALLIKVVIFHVQVLKV